jgi:putative heme-binding domain-containing protein
MNRHRVSNWTSALALAISMAACPLYAAEPESPLVKLLRSGKVTADRMPVVVEMLCRNASADDLRYLYERVIDPEGLPAGARAVALAGLADAARNRQVRPTGDLSGIAGLIEAPPTPEVQLAAIRLATLWEVADVVEPLSRVALDPSAGEPLRAAALDAVAVLGGESAATAIQALLAADQPQPLRYRAVAALARFDLAAAAEQAALVLPSAGPDEQLWPLLEPFLTRQGGAEAMAAALDARPPDVELAKRLLRAMYASGHNDPALSESLSRIAGIEAEPPPPTPAEVAQLATEAAAQGDPVRGEAMFRSRDLGCLKCHSLAGAGGQVGPELSAVGGSSPMDYIVNSILNPSLAIKEQFVTRIVQTDDGQVWTGIVVERDENRLRLKDATGQVVEIPTATIEDEAEGKSMMPVGLTRFLSRQELLDLVRFISELGKPGPYAVRQSAILQRYRVLLPPVSDDLCGEAPNTELVRERVVDAVADSFAPAYATALGDLPLAEFAAEAMEPGVIFLQGELEVRLPGRVGLRIAAPAGTLLWLDGAPYQEQREFSAELPVGRHKLTLRVPAADDAGETLRVEAYKPEDSTAEFGFVGGA